MYVVGYFGNDINEYSLTTAFDVSTASFNQLFSVAAQDGTPSGMTFNDDGTKMYIVGTQHDKVYEYSLDNPTNSNSLCKRCYYQYYFQYHRCYRYWYSY